MEETSPTDDIIGSGWAFPVETDYDEAIDRSGGVEKIEESIRLILGTAKGERVMRPDFGCGIHEYVFATVDTATLSRVESAVRRAIEQWEPRVDVVDVEASPERIDSGLLRIGLTYRVRRTNNEYNMTYPFYLTE